MLSVVLMKSLIFSLRRVIFLSFILFTVFAGEKSGCQCVDSLSSHSSQGNSSGGQSSSSQDGNSVQGKKNPSNQGLQKGTNSQNSSLQPLNNAETTASLPNFWTPQSHFDLSHCNSENSFGSQNAKNSMFQIQNNFCSVFEQVKEILEKLKKNNLPSVFDEGKPPKIAFDVYYAYSCLKIGNQQIRQKIENWINSNQSEFLNYFIL